MMSITKTCVNMMVETAVREVTSIGLVMVSVMTSTIMEAVNMMGETAVELTSKNIIAWNVNVLVCFINIWNNSKQLKYIHYDIEHETFFFRWLVKLQILWVTPLIELPFKFSVFTCQTDEECNWNGYCHRKEEYCICLEGYHYRHDCSEFGCKYFKTIQNLHIPLSGKQKHVSIKDTPCYYLNLDTIM